MDAGALELVELDETVLDDDCRCMSAHEDRFNRICSETVVAVSGSCVQTELLACADHARYVRDCIQDGISLCYWCKQPVSLCWTIRPV